MRPRGRRWIHAIAPIFMIGAIAAAQQPTTAPVEHTDPLLTTPEPAPDSVDEKLIDAAARPAGILKFGPVSLVDPLWKQLNKSLDQIGLKLGLAYTAVYQAASGGPGIRDAGGGDADFFGNWRLLGLKEGQTNGYLYFATEYRHDMTRVPRDVAA